MSTYIDLRSLERLKEAASDCNKERFVQDIVELFLTSYPSSLKSLEEAVHLQDGRRIQRSSHHLRGLCLNVGAMMMANLCAQIEAADIPANIHHVHKWTLDLREAADKTAQSLRALQY